jgi:Family of unknown function (DUF5990)
MRLIRSGDLPVSHDRDEEYVFGLQDKQQEIVAGKRQRDGKLVFNFSLQVKAGSDSKRPIFTGRFASGPVDDRFVYLSWRSVKRGEYISRIKARLAGITWAMVRAAQAADRALVADMTGWRPHDSRKTVEWRLG